MITTRWWRRGSGADQPRLMKPVADTADGLDELARLAQLLPQALDVHVNRPLEDDRILADGRVHQLVASERPSGLADQRLEQAELGGRQRQLLVPVERAVAVAVADHPPASDDPSRPGLLPALGPAELPLYPPGPRPPTA